jgi:transposase
MLSIAEIRDITRFPTTRHLFPWARLRPSVGSSEGKSRLRHIRASVDAVLSAIAAGSL